MKDSSEGHRKENGSGSMGGSARAGHAAAKAALSRGHHDLAAVLGLEPELPAKRCSAAEMNPSQAGPPGHASTQRQQDDNKKGGTTSTKAHSLIDKVYRWENLVQAYRRVKANKGAHGLDRVTLAMFDTARDIHLREIQRKLMQNRYQWQPVMRVYIPKSSNPKESRPLGIPTVSDRIVGQAIMQVVDPIFDIHMSDRSFAYRKGRSAHDAIAMIESDLKAGLRFVVDSDIKSCFDEISYSIAMSCVEKRIADGRVLSLIQTYLKSGVSENGNVSVPERGIPQGGALSPLIMNLVLDNLDQRVQRNGFRMVRYADDFVILCSTRQEAQTALALCKQTLTVLELRLHPTKTSIVNAWNGFSFLGFRFIRGCVTVLPKAIDRFKDKIRALTKRQQGRNLEAVIEDIVPRIRGWARYYGVAQCTRVFTELDKWIRMRLRGFKFKRRNHNDNWRLSNKALTRYGFLSLLECRPRVGRLELLKYVPTTEGVAP